MMRERTACFVNLYTNALYGKENSELYNGPQKEVSRAVTREPTDQWMQHSQLIYQRLYCGSDTSLQTIGNLTYMHYTKTHNRHNLEWSSPLDAESSRNSSQILLISKR